MGKIIEFASYKANNIGLDEEKKDYTQNMSFWDASQKQT